MAFIIELDAYGQQYIYRNGSLIDLVSYKSKRSLERYVGKCAGGKEYTIEYRNR